MSPWLSRLGRLFRSRKDAPRPRRYRPTLESLEERCLPSGGFVQVNLASDVPGLARVTDPNLVNPWGVSFSPTSPFWFADNGAGVADLLDGRGLPTPLVVSVPGADGSSGAPTGTVFNGGPGFFISENGVSRSARFLFATEDGGIFAWSGAVDLTRALPVVDESAAGAVYTGLALATDPAGQTFLYAADFGRGAIDVFDQDFRPVMRPGAFRDPNLPGDFVPFNIQKLNGLLFVTYAQRDAGGRDNVAGEGNGFIDVYNADGVLVRRFASQGPLDSPWGIALAPSGFGSFGGALLVGNNGDGRINAYDPVSGAFLGQLVDGAGAAITIPNLWALTFGNGHAGGDSNTLFFTAGVDYQAHGLFGAIQAPQRRGADTGGVGGFDPNAPGEPGDYPLPPSGGPVLLSGGVGPSLPTAVLLPLSESSLALIPTLSRVPPPGTRVERPVPGAPAAASFNMAAANDLLASGDSLLAPADAAVSPQEASLNNAIALNTFLDLNASAAIPDIEASDRRPHPGSDPGDARGPRAGILRSAPRVEATEARLSAEKGLESAPLSSQAVQAPPQATLEGRPEPADKGLGINEGDESQARGRWTKLLVSLLPVTATTAALGYLLGTRQKSPQPGPR